MGALFFSLQERWACLTRVFHLQVSSSAGALCLEGKMMMVTATQGSPTGMLVVVSVELAVSPYVLTRSALQIGCTCLSHKPYQENLWLHCNCKWLLSAVALQIKASNLADHCNQSLCWFVTSCQYLYILYIHTNSNFYSSWCFPHTLHHSS